jgi:hypothetical protein
MNLNVTVPVNAVSFGFVAYNILKEFYLRGLSPCLFPVGQPDLSSFDKIAPDFGMWLQSCFSKAGKRYSRKNPEFRLWHINGSESSHSEKQALLTFHETDQLTEIEANVLNNQNKVFTTSSFTKSVFENYGVENVVHTPLGFDAENFKNLNQPHPYNKESIVFGLLGKWEPKRKHTDKVIKLWVKKYGNNPRYRLHLHVFNNFLNPDPAKCAEINKNLILQCFEGKEIWNVNVINGHLRTLSEYNALINSCDILLDGSLNENWSVPHFHGAAIGKHLVAGNANGVADWANDENAVLFNPVGKEECYDGMFFHQGQPFNQGNFFIFKDEDFIEAMEKAEQRYLANPVNEAGKKLVEKFNWKNTVDTIISNIN